MRSEDLFSAMQDVPIPSFLSYFTSAISSAYRLELLSSYIVEQEINAIEQFRKNPSLRPPDFNQDWTSLISGLKARRVKIQRVRLVDEPISEYLKFEIKWGYTSNITAGEEIRIIERSAFDDIARIVPITRDFWLFDEKKCVMLEYDFVGRFLGLKALPEDTVDQYVQLKRLTLERSNHLQVSKYWRSLVNN